MVRRLVLGCDATGLSVVEALNDRRGELYVVEPSESRVEQLRNAKIPAETGDVTDPEVLEKLDFDPEMVMLLQAGAESVLEAARAARAVFPDSFIVAFACPEVRTEVRAELEPVVDQLTAAGSALVDSFETSFVDGNISRLRELRAVLRGMDGKLAIFSHDNPDPDAIGSALALSAVATWFDVDTEVYYFGDISHQENRAFVNLLEFDLEDLDPEDSIEFDHLALVDHSAPGVNNQLDPETPVDIVIDHHPPKEEVEADFVDVRSAVGATSTLLVDYLQGFDIEVPTEIATGLLYGIRVDTRDFTQEITTADFEAAAYLLPKADIQVLSRIESPSVSPDTLDITARSIRNRRVRGPVLTTCAGSITNRDALAQAADRLLNMEAIRVTVVYGFRDGTIYLSARSRGVEVDLGEILRRAFGDIGSAGGHNNMAGAQIPLGVFDAVEDEAAADLTEIVEDVVETRFYEVFDPDTIEE